MRSENISKFLVPAQGKKPASAVLPDIPGGETPSVPAETTNGQTSQFQQLLAELIPQAAGHAATTEASVEKNLWGTLPGQPAQTPRRNGAVDPDPAAEIGPKPEQGISLAPSVPLPISPLMLLALPEMAVAALTAPAAHDDAPSPALAVKAGQVAQPAVAAVTIAAKNVAPAVVLTPDAAPGKGSNAAAVPESPVPPAAPNSRSLVEKLLTPVTQESEEARGTTQPADASMPIAKKVPAANAQGAIDVPAGFEATEPDVRTPGEISGARAMDLELAARFPAPALTRSSRPARPAPVESTPSPAPAAEAVGEEVKVPLQVKAEGDITSMAVAEAVRGVQDGKKEMPVPVANRAQTPTPGDPAGIAMPENVTPVPGLKAAMVRKGEVQPGEPAGVQGGSPKAALPESNGALPAADPAPRAAGITAELAASAANRTERPPQATAAPSRAEAQAHSEGNEAGSAGTDPQALVRGMASPGGSPDGDAGDLLMGRNGGSAMHQGSPMLKADPALAAEKPAAHSLLGESLPPEVSRNVLDQVIKGVSVQIQGSTSEMRLTLKPESLGEVVVRVRMEDGKMQAQIDVTQAGVKAALESNLPQLHEALAARGIDVQRIDVNAGGQSMLQDRQGRSDERRLRRSMSDTAPDGVEQYQAVKLVGYNTMDLIM